MAALLSAAGISTAGCHARTEIVLGVLTDLRAPDVLDEVQLDAAVEGVPVLLVPWQIRGVPGQPYILPGSYGVYSESGGSPQVDITITGSKNGRPIVTRRALVSLVNEKTLFMRLALVAGCQSRTDCKADESCVEGLCKPALVDARRLPLYVDGMERTLQCLSGTSFIDTGTGAPVPMSGTGCGAGETCEEGTCYKPIDGAMPSGLWVSEAPPMAAVGKTIHAASISLSIGPGASPELWAVGDTGLVIHRLDDAGPMAAASWVTETVPSTATLNAIDATSAADVWVAGDEVVLHRTGSTWSAIPATGMMLNAIAQGPTGPVFVGSSKSAAAAQAGVILRWTGTALAMEQTPMGPELFGIAAIGGGNFVAVGQNGRILRSEGRVWSDLASLAGGMPIANLHGATALPGGETLLVGDNGTVLRLGASTLTKVEAPTTKRLLAALATPRIIVGEGGTILTADSTGALTVEQAPSAADVLGVAVTPVGTTQQRLLAVGRSGSLWTSLRDL